MEIKRLDHVNVRTCNLAEMIDWYVRVLGMTSGARPPLGVGGAWMYVDDRPVVHLVEVETACAAVDPRIEHFAFSAIGYDAFIERLDANGVAHHTSRVPDTPIVQVNISDFDGNHIHVDFPAHEA